MIYHINRNYLGNTMYHINNVKHFSMNQQSHSSVHYMLKMYVSETEGILKTDHRNIVIKHSLNNVFHYNGTMILVKHMLN